eukprot:8030721-Alexandrium_andersonii.AAC.1
MLLEPKPALDEEEALCVRLQLELVAQRSPEFLRQELVEAAGFGILFELAATRDLELAPPRTSRSGSRARSSAAHLQRCGWAQRFWNSRWEERAALAPRVRE